MDQVSNTGVHGMATTVARKAYNLPAHPPAWPCHRTCHVAPAGEREYIGFKCESRSPLNFV